MQILADEFIPYWPEYNNTEAKATQKLIRKPFGINVEEVVEEIQEEIIKLQNDKYCKDAFESDFLK